MSAFPFDTKYKQRKAVKLLVQKGFVTMHHKLKPSRALSTKLWHLCLLMMLLSLPTAPLGASRTSPFSKSNLHVWAYEEYDAVKRSPTERAQLLKELGIHKAGYICRNAKRTAEFESYLNAYREHGIELVGVWTPVHTKAPLSEPQIKGFLEAVDRYQLQIQWWLTLEHPFDKDPESTRVQNAVRWLQPLLAEANKRACRLVIYGHGRKKWFTQSENQLEILKHLNATQPNAALGIIYNFHQSHAQMDRFARVLPQLKPHLAAVNLNGMHSDGLQIAPLGSGNREREMIQLIHQSGWHGPVGIIGHVRTEDSRTTLQRNLDGLKTILSDIGDQTGASSY